MNSLTVSAKYYKIDSVGHFILFKFISLLNVIILCNSYKQIFRKNIGLEYCKVLLMKFVNERLVIKYLRVFIQQLFIFIY